MMITYNLRRAVSRAVTARGGGSLPESFFVQTVTLFDLIERVLLEGALDIVEDVVHMVFVWTDNAG